MTDFEWEIYPPFEAFYIESMLWHTESARQSIKAVGDWIALIENKDERALELPKESLFSHLQNIVQQAGAISRFFWPVRNDKIHKNRGCKLRSAFKVTDNSPLKDRGLRNAIEHFDEKLDIYLTANVVGEIITTYVDYVEPNNEVPLHIFKGFYVYPKIFVLLGEKYEIAPLVKEINKIHQSLLYFSKNELRLPND